MPQTSAIVASRTTIRATDHNKIVADLAELYNLSLSDDATFTYNGRRISQIDWNGSRIVFNYTGSRVTSIEYHLVAGVITYTWTYTWTGNKITATVRS